MLINLFGRWVNPQNILAIISDHSNPEEKLSKVIFSNTSEAGFKLEFKDKTPAEIATEINTAVAASRKSSFGDRGERRGGDRGGFKGGRDRDGGYKKKFNRDEKPAYGSEEHKERVRKDFSDRKERKFEGGKKYEPRGKGGDYKPKKRRDEY